MCYPLVPLSSDIVQDIVDLNQSPEHDADLNEEDCGVAVKLKTEWNCLADLLQDMGPDEEMKLEEEMVDEAFDGVNL